MYSRDMGRGNSRGGGGGGRLQAPDLIEVFGAEGDMEPPLPGVASAARRPPSWAGFILGFVGLRLGYVFG